MDLLKPESWPRAPGFSWGTAATGRCLFVAGQIGKNPETGVLEEGFGPQTARAFENITAVLQSGGATPHDIAHMTWYVTNLDAYRAAGREIGEAYKQTFGRHFPSMTMIQVAGLLDPKALVEIDCVAVVGES